MEERWMEKILLILIFVYFVLNVVEANELYVKLTLFMLIVYFLLLLVSRIMIICKKSRRGNKLS